MQQPRAVPAHPIICCMAIMGFIKGFIIGFIIPAMGFMPIIGFITPPMPMLMLKLVPPPPPPVPPSTLPLRPLLVPATGDVRLTAAWRRESLICTHAAAHQACSRQSCEQCTRILHALRRLVRAPGHPAGSSLMHSVLGLHLHSPAVPCFAGGSYGGMLVRAAVSRQASSKQGTSSSEPGTC